MTKQTMTRDLWTMAVRNISRRPRRSFLSIVAIGLAALTMTFLLSLVAGIRADMGSNIQRYLTGQVLVEDRGMARAGTLPLALAISSLPKVMEPLAAVPGVALLSPRITSGASVFEDGDAVFFSLMGLDFANDPMRLQEFLLPGGTLPAPGERQALISNGLAEKLGLKVGDTLTAVTQTLRGSSNGMTFTVSGLVHPGLAAFQVPWLFTSLPTAQRFTKLSQGATSLVITASPGTDSAALAGKIQQTLDQVGFPHLASRPWFQTSTTWGLMDLAGIVYGVMGLIFFALASTVIINTMLMVVLERSKEIGMLAALGMDPRQIRWLFLAESAILSGIGAVGGTLLGCLLSLVLGITGLDFTESMKGVDMEVSNIFRPVLEPWTPLLVMVVAVTVALVFTLVPVQRLKNMQIVDALRGEI